MRVKTKPQILGDDKKFAVGDPASVLTVEDIKQDL